MRISKTKLNPAILFDPLEDNKSVTKIIELPPLVDCQWSPQDCGSTWNISHCQADIDFYQPIKNGDLINIQTQFLDTQNLSPLFSCPPPSQYSRAVAEITFADSANAVYADSGSCVYYQLSFTFLGCDNTADNAKTRLCSYNNFDEWVDGVISYYVDNGAVGSGIVTRTAKNRMKISWDVEHFKLLFGRDICTEELKHCFYRITPLPGIETTAIPLVTTTFEIECCQPETECVTIAQGEDGGCSIPDGKALFKFTINPNPSYVFGSAAQITANVSDAAIAFVRNSDPICPDESVINPLLKFSNATDFADYVDNVCTYLNTAYCLPSDSVTCNNITGEIEILFDVSDHVDLDGWDPCKDKISICYPTFEVPKSGGVCDFTGAYKIIKIAPTVYTPFTVPDNFFLFDFGGNFTWTPTGLDNSSYNNYIADIINRFQTDFPNSVVKKSGLSMVVGLYLTFYINLLDAPDACKGTLWATDRGEVIDQSLCCDKVCAVNAVDEISATWDYIDPPAGPVIIPLTSFRFRILYSFGGGVLPTIQHGLYVPFNTTDLSKVNDIVLGLLNNPGILASKSFTDPHKWRATADTLWFPTSAFPGDCNELNIRLEITRYNPAFGMWSAYYVNDFDINCCQSDCLIPPAYVEFSWRVTDAGINWGSDFFYSFLNIVPQSADCSDLFYSNDALPYSVKTSEVGNLTEYANLTQQRLMNLFDETFLGNPGSTSVQITMGANYYDFKLRTYRYHSKYGDLCDGLKICPGNNSGEGGTTCYHSFGIRFLTLDSYVLEDGVYKFSYDLVLKCNGSTGVTETYTKTISFNLYSLPTLDDVISAFVIKMNMLGLNMVLLPSPPYTFEFRVPETDFFCMCDGSPNYVSSTLTKSADTGIDHYGKTSQIIWFKENLHIPGGGGDGVMLEKSAEVFAADCCAVCTNPFGYVSFSFEADHPMIQDFAVGFWDQGQCNVAAWLDFKPGYVTKAGLVSEINTLHMPNMYAELTGNTIKLFMKNPLNCACNDPNGLAELYVDINGSTAFIGKQKPDCCAGEGVAGTEQLPEVEITDQKCCPDFVTSVELVDCCCNKIDGFDVRTALTGHLFGQNSAPLAFFQNYQFDSALIPFDCFAFKIAGSDGRVHYTECYRKETCLSTVELCSEFEEGKKDCDGYIYGLPEFGCPAVLEPLYSNCCKIPGSIQTTSFNFENPRTGERTTQEHITFRTALIPPYMVSKLKAILGGNNITIDGKKVTFEGAISKEREQGDMWVVTMELLGEECSINSICD